MDWSRSPVRRGAHALRIALLAFAVVGLTQCRLVADRVTGADGLLLLRSSVADCMSGCAGQRRDATVEETRLHIARIRLCDSGDEACLVAENERHRAAMAAIQAAYEQCLADCHHQGGGSGGD